MTIENVFAVKSGVAVVGVISTGELGVGDKLVVDTDTTKIQVQVEGIELVFWNPVQRANAGDSVGILLTGVKMDQVSRNDVLRSL